MKRFCGIKVKTAVKLGNLVVWDECSCFLFLCCLQFKVLNCIMEGEF